MKEFIEKLIGRLEELRQTQVEELCEHKDLTSEMQSMRGFNMLQDAIKIVNQLAEEYADNEVLSMIQMNNDFQKAKLEELKQIRADVMAGGWIPCSERLPEVECGESGTVLASTVNRLGEMPMLKLAYYDGSCWCHPNGEVMEYRNVIAWQPLPAPYQPKGE